MDNISCIIPFFNGEQYINKLIDGIPRDIPILIVDDLSDVPYKLNRDGATVFRLKKKGYFTGAVNYGLAHTNTDVLVLNQDAQFSNDKWIEFIEGYRPNYAMIGERIKGNHPVWTEGYIHGTFMFIRRDVIEKVGLMNEKDYPLWGSTCEYQLRVCRDNFPVLATDEIPGFIHARNGRFGAAINTVLEREPSKRRNFIKTPPEVSVIIPCYNYGKFLPSAINSLVGGQTDLGEMPQQTFASFEVIIVNDGSTDNTSKIIAQLVDPRKGIRSVKKDKTEGTATAINAGIKASYGRYITILGADDMRKTDALELLYRNQIKHTHSFVYDGVVAFADGKLRPDMHYGVSKFDFERLLYKNHIHAGIMFPKKAWEDIGGYPEAFGDGREDWAVNIAFGIKGYCGVYIDGYNGYLYRREGHNRSTRNGNQRGIFLGKLKLQFPEIYQGERPEMCCGGKKKPVILSGNKKTKTKGVVLMDTEKMILIEYIGSNYGTASFYGVKTGSQYRAGKSKPVFGADKTDLYGTQIRPGLLEMKENGKPIFRLYVLPKQTAPVKKAPAVQKKAAAPAEHKITGVEANLAPTDPQDYLLGAKDEEEVKETVKKTHPARKRT